VVTEEEYRLGKLDLRGDRLPGGFERKRAHLTDKGYQQWRLWQMNHSRGKLTATYQFSPLEPPSKPQPVDKWGPSSKWLSSIYPDQPSRWAKEPARKPLRDHTLKASEWIRNEEERRKRIRRRNNKQAKPVH
jgi:hypothetical protein